MRSVTLIENASGKGGQVGLAWSEGSRRREHSTVCTALEEKLGFKPMPESQLLSQAWTNRREGIIWEKH